MGVIWVLWNKLESIFSLILFHQQVGSNSKHHGSVRFYILPLMKSLFFLVRLYKGHQEVVFKKLLLNSCKISISLELQLNSLSKLAPVKVTYSFFDLVFAKIRVSLAEDVHVEFDQVFILDAFRNVELRTFIVLDSWELFVEHVQSVNFLYFKPNQVRLSQRTSIFFL